MKTIQFTYTKDDGSVSERTVCLTKEPGTMFAGVDISELSVNERALYEKDMLEAKGIYEEMVAQINAEHDTQHRYRNFIPSKMSKLKVLETIS